MQTSTTHLEYPVFLEKSRQEVLVRQVPEGDEISAVVFVEPARCKAADDRPPTFSPARLELMPVRLASRDVKSPLLRLLEHGNLVLAQQRLLCSGVTTISSRIRCLTPHRTRRHAGTWNSGW